MTRLTLLPSILLIFTLFAVFQDDGLAQGQYEEESYGPPGHRRRQGHPHGGPPGRRPQGGARPMDVVFPDEIGRQTGQSVEAIANVGNIESNPTNSSIRDIQPKSPDSDISSLKVPDSDISPLKVPESSSTDTNGEADPDQIDTRIFSGSGGLNFLTGAVNAAAGILGIPLNIESVNPSLTTLQDGNYAICRAPMGMRGKCIFARNCMYRLFAQSEQLFANYACTIQRQFESYVGICCPEMYIRPSQNQGGYAQGVNYGGGSTGVGGYGFQGLYPEAYSPGYSYPAVPDNPFFPRAPYGNQGTYRPGTTDTGTQPQRERDEADNTPNSNTGGYPNTGSYPNYGENGGLNVPPQYGGQRPQTYPNVYPPERPNGGRPNTGGGGGWNQGNGNSGWNQGGGTGGWNQGNGNAGWNQGRPHGNGNGGRPNGGRPHGNGGGGGRPHGGGGGGRPHGNGGGGRPNGGRPGGRPRPPQRPWTDDERQTSAALYDGCGVNFKTRIVGGVQSEQEQWPWMGALLRPSDMRQPFCGGALINERCLLTAAHCTNGMSAKDINVRLGEYDFSRTDEDEHQDFTVSQIKQHEMYDKSTNLNDVSILILDRPARIGDDVTPICLADPKEWVAGKQATVAGWGTMSYGGSTSPVLRHVTVPIWKNPECYESLKKNITRNFLCAGNPSGGQDSCQGDSGGPLMFQDQDNRWHVIGIVSWGIRCAEPNSPGVYSRVARYLPWIIEHCKA